MAEVSEYTPGEIINMWHGWIWRHQQKENMIAGLVTTWIANSAGKTYKKRLTVKDIFKDGRFNRRKLTDSDLKILEELEDGGPL